MTPFSKRKLLEQSVIILGLVLALVKTYTNWKLDSRHYSGFDLMFGIAVVTLIVSGILMGLYFLIHQLERKWKTQLCNKENTHPWSIRPAADSGITTLPLLPLALLLSLMNFWQYISHPYTIITVLSVGFLFTSMAYLWKTSEKKDDTVNSLVTVSAISSVKVALALWHLKLLGLTGSCVVAFGSQVLYLLVLRQLLVKCPKSFSIGEALMTAQGISCVLLASAVWLAAKVFQICGPTKQCHFGDTVTQLTYVVVLAVAFLVALALTLDSMQRPLPFYLCCLAVGGLFVYPTWFGILREEPIMWLLRWTMYESFGRTLLFVHWLGCTVFSVVLVSWANAAEIRITTSVRKIFHAVVILIYVPGLLWDNQLLYFAASFAFALFVAVECVRLLKVAPFGRAIDVALKPFLDEKDSGILILTHIYLLVGCSLSLWLFPLKLTKNVFRISLASGIASLGFGDTAASVGGVALGKHRWPDTKKTIEGTVIAFIVQGSVTLALYLIFSSTGGTVVQILNSVYILVVTALSCVLEGVTTQIDNLLIPTFLYIMLVPT